MRTAVACLVLAVPVLLVADSPALLFAVDKDKEKGKDKGKDAKEKDVFKDFKTPTERKPKPRTDWKEQDIDGKCSVLLPGKPEPKVVKDGGADVAVYMLTARDGKSAFVVAYNELPAKMSDTEADKAMLAGRDQAKEKLEGKHVGDFETDELAHGSRKYKGFRFTIGLAKPDKTLYRARVFMVDKTFFQVAVMGPTDWVKEKDGEAESFLDSFKLPAAR